MFKIQSNIALVERYIMQKLSLGTKNLVNENIAKLEQIFPNVVKEGKVDFEALKQELSDYLIEGCKERYGLNWVGKRESILKANTSIKKTLHPIKEKSIDFENTKNLYIEGDNFEALKIIQESYLNKIKMIYIDPPYNTGKDFIYKDRFAQSKKEYEGEVETVDEEGVKLFKNTDSNGRFHSDWLSMMYERLLIARDLLREDGVIFISIDDNEMHNLRHLCNEVFGEGNYIQEIIWEKKFSPQNDAKFFSLNHEQIICYAKNKEKFQRNLLPMTDEQKSRYKNLDNDPRGPWQSGDLTVARKTERDIYEIITPSGKKIYPPEGRSWAISKQKFEELLKDNRIWFGPKGENVPRLKRFLSDIQQGMVPKSIWYYNEVGHTQEARQETKKLFDNKAFFDYPKPVRLLKRILHLSTSKTDIILDFFSGSATTAHAVMQLNAEDGGNRQFIMVQIPKVVDEKSKSFKAGFRTIAEIGRERIIRTAKKIKEDFRDKEYINSLDFGFRYFKVDSSNFKDTKEIGEITQENLFDTVNNIKPDRDDLDLLFEVILSLGLELTLQIETKEILGKRVYFLKESASHKVECNSLIACSDNEIDENLVKELATYKPLKVVLQDSSFKRDSDKINFEQTFKELSPDTDIWVV